MGVFHYECSSEENGAHGRGDSGAERLFCRVEPVCRRRPLQKRLDRGDGDGDTDEAEGVGLLYRRGGRDLRQCDGKGREVLSAVERAYGRRTGRKRNPRGAWPADWRRLRFRRRGWRKLRQRGGRR